MPSQVYILIAAAAVMFFVIGGLSLLAHYYTLNGMKLTERKVRGKIALGEEAVKFQ